MSTGVTNLSVGAPTNVAKAVEATRGRAVLIGNVSSGLFISDSRQDMAAAIRDCIQQVP